MFANNDEDFEFPEDFLNDVAHQESQYYSQSLAEAEDCPRKKFKRTDQTTTTEVSSPEATVAKAANNANNIRRTAATRRNMIVERLKRFQNPSEIEPTDSKRSVDSEPSENIHEPLDKNADEPTKESRSAKATVPTRVERKDDRRNLILHRLRNKSQEISSPCLDFSGEKIEKEIPTKTGGEKYRSIVAFAKPVTRVREFPGPAGLLPDLANGTIAAKLLVSLDSIPEQSEASPGKESTMTEFCSQSTSDLFSEGAWQTLVEDLDESFLNGHEISSIKERVRRNTGADTKVPFLAGVIKSISFNTQCLSVSLKDFSGSVEATIDKKLLAECPQWLEKGVVLFLGNVGLVITGVYRQNFQAIVTSKNLINIYRGRSRMFDVSEMRDRLRNARVECGHESALDRRVARGFVGSRAPMESGNPGVVRSSDECDKSKPSGPNVGWGRSRYFRRGGNRWMRRPGRQAPVGRSLARGGSILSHNGPRGASERPSEPVNHEEARSCFDTGEFGDLDDEFFLDNLEEELDCAVSGPGASENSGKPPGKSEETGEPKQKGREDTIRGSEMASGLFSDDEMNSDELLSQLDIDAIASDYNSLN